MKEKTLSNKELDLQDNSKLFVKMVTIKTNFKLSSRLLKNLQKLYLTNHRLCLQKLSLFIVTLTSLLT